MRFPPLKPRTSGPLARCSIAWANKDCATGVFGAGCAARGNIYPCRRAEGLLFYPAPAGHAADNLPPVKMKASAEGLVASAIARASSNQTYVRIGLPIPNDYFATLLSVDGDDEVSIAVTIAFFVLKAEEIEETIKRESRAKGIAGGVKLHLEPGGSFVAQWDDEDFGYHEIRIE